MKILITGGSGLVGTCLGEHETYGHSLLVPSHAELDITDEDSIKYYFIKHSPQAVFHLAAFRNVTGAETERGDEDGQVWKTNVVGARIIAQGCHLVGAHMTFISSNMVFSGEKRSPYLENDSPSPNDTLSWYGITKKQGERVTRDTLADSAVIRIANPTDSLALKGEDYVGKIYNLYKEDKLYPLFDDQVVSLTPLRSLNEVMFRLAEERRSGVFHVSTPDVTTPFNLARQLISRLGGGENVVMATKIADYLTSKPRRYPRYGALSSEATRSELGLEFPNIDEILGQLIKTYVK